MFEEIAKQQPPLLQRWFAPDFSQPSYLRARWIWLRALGGIFFSAFYSLYFQIHGLIGPNGILPATAYLDAVRRAFGLKRYWFAPTLLCIVVIDRALDVIVWARLAASSSPVLHFWPGFSIAILRVCLF